VTSNLATRTRPDVFLNQSPIFSKFLKSFKKPSVFRICPTTSNFDAALISLRYGAVLSLGQYIWRIGLNRRFGILMLKDWIHKRLRLLICQHLMCGRSWTLEICDLCRVTHKCFSDGRVEFFTCLEAALSVSIRSHEVVSGQICRNFACWGCFINIVECLFEHILTFRLNNY